METLDLILTIPLTLNVTNSERRHIFFRFGFYLFHADVSRSHFRVKLIRRSVIGNEIQICVSHIHAVIRVFNSADTVELFDYGFHNFQVLNISENEEKYNIESTGFLQIGNDVFGSSKPILSIDTESYVIIPNTVSFQDLDSEIDYSQSNENLVAGIFCSAQVTRVCLESSVYPVLPPKIPS